MSRKAVVSPLVDRWRIAEMEMWDKDYPDMEVKAFIEFESDGIGHFQFGLVRGCIDYRSGERDGKPVVEWSWEGNDECDPAMGRGWAVLESATTITGRIFFHQGDDSSFQAERITASRQAERSLRDGIHRSFKHRPRS